MTSLLALLRALPDDAESFSVDPVSWPALLDETDVHGLTALVHHHLAERVPPAERARLQSGAHAATARALRLKRLLHFVLDGFAGLGIVPVVLKGFGLSTRIWPEWHLRPSGDVDVLVAPDQLEVAARWLEAQGFGRHEDPGEDDPHEHHHHVGFAGPKGLVEVHFRALAGPGGGALGGDALLACCTEATLDARRVRYLPAEDELVYLSSHAAQHLFQRVAWLYDLKLFVRANPGLSWPRVADVAAASHLRSATHAALTLAKELLAADIPDDALERLAPTRAHRRLVLAAFTPDRLAGATLARSKAAPAMRALISDTPARAAKHLLEGAARRAKRVLRGARE